jgi:hypothetical protein
VDRGWWRKMDVSRLLAGFFIEFAQANLDARTQPYQVLQHRIMEIQKYMPEMMDYMRREAHVI